MHVFRRLFSALNRENIGYMVAGGIAVNLYGIERATADIDIVIRLVEQDLTKFVNVARELGLQPKAPVKLEEIISPEKRESWIKEKGMMVFSLFDDMQPFFLLDIFIDAPFDFEKVYRNRKIFKFENTDIPVVPVKELIAMKTGTGRPQDAADIFYLEKIEKDWSDEG